MLVCALATPFDANVFEFRVFQGGRISQAMRIMAAGIEVQTPGGRFVRFIENDPRRRAEYEEFRRIADHLQWLNDERKLFVRSLVFTETLVADFADTPRAEDINNAFGAGLRWRQKPDGDLPVRGAIKLRSMVQILTFVADGIRAAPEFEVAPDPRTGGAVANAPATLTIRVTDESPDPRLPSVRFRGRNYVVGDTRWDRASFTMLNTLFQSSVGTVEDVAIPITVAK